VTPNFARVEKAANPSAVERGGVVAFTVTITLGSGRDNLVLADTITGIGRAPATHIVPGSFTLDGEPGGPTTITLTSSPNRIEYRFLFDTLAAGQHILTYHLQVDPNLRCATGTNEGALSDTGGFLSSSRISFSVKCT
jgi:hypothetical protein